MDLILQDQSGNDVMVLNPASVDMAYGVGDDPENDMEICMPDRSPSMKRGMFVYVEGTAYGGMLTGVSSKSGLEWHGRTWFGLLASKVLVPDGGVGALTVSGNANDVLRSIVSRIGLSSVFKVASGKSPITVKSHTFDMYQDALNGIVEMLSGLNGKLMVSHENGNPVLSAIPLKDWSKDDEFDSDQVDLTVDIDYLPVNHLVGRGEGQDGERTNVELYMDDKGNVSTSSQSLKGALENAEYYNYTTADRDTLIKDGTKRLKEYYSKAKSINVTLAAGLDRYDIGDRIGGTDPKTGISATASVVKKIVRFDGNGNVTVEFETGAI